MSLHSELVREDRVEVQRQKTTTMKTKETYIADGSKFRTMEEVEAYAKRKGLRVVSTETLRKGTYLIDLRSAEPINQHSLAYYEMCPECSADMTGGGGQHYAICSKAI